jgi:hypothetical protein
LDEKTVATWVYAKAVMSVGVTVVLRVVLKVVLWVGRTACEWVDQKVCV